MEQDTKLTVNGFLFATPEDAQKADLELKKIQYLESKIDYANTRKVQAIYEKAVGEHFFHTAVGIFYLKGIRDFLVREDERYEEVLPYVPIPVTVENGDRGEQPQGEGNMHDKAEREGAKTKTAQKKREAENQKGIKELKQRFWLSVLISCVLAVAVIVMFFITVRSDQPNILNYEKAIKNRYATWEQELTEREKAVREKELELFRETE